MPLEQQGGTVVSERSAEGFIEDETRKELLKPVERERKGYWDKGECPAPPAEMGNTRAQKHSDMQLAEVLAMREQWGVGYTQIAYLTGIPRSTVRSYLSGKRRGSMLSSNEFQQMVGLIKKGMPKNAPASRSVVERASRKAREQAAKDEKQMRLDAGRIEHVPVPTHKQIQAEAQRIAALRNGMQKQVQQPARDLGTWNQEWMDNLKRAGVTRSAPKHVIQKYRPTWRPER
ncbi:hypothetical protein [Vibrio alginolyticus]|uniref:hypothetical protein n=1 Tax=Vibrio alginolyticus TaxID=663 RepID=UPI00215F1B51|nr:hypothetical protein [Vibrio alginolyticus]MCS0134827.1 hypothetical protein [Vibrio alginolyticus]